jgi:hypothetical protein
MSVGSVLVLDSPECCATLSKPRDSLRLGGIVEDVGWQTEDDPRETSATKKHVADKRD